MPFYNIPSTEAMGLAEYGERSKAVKTGSGDTAFLDHVVRIMERRLYHYALTQTAAAADDDVHVVADEPEGETSSGAHANTTMTVERPLPYPSLFLNTPHAVVRCSWESRDDAATRRTRASALSQRLPPPPPASLLAEPESEKEREGGEGEEARAETAPGAAVANAVAEDDTPSWADVSTLAKNQQPPHLTGEGPQTLAAAAEIPGGAETRLPFTLDLSRDRGVCERVNVVLQTEVGLAITAPTHHEGAVTPASDPGTFLMSPDATSCVLVACRVRLHPRWRLSPTASEAAGGAELFAAMCSETITAAMAHLDGGSDKAEAALHEMLWHGALPAWLHAMVEHYHRKVVAETEEGSPEPAERREEEKAWRGTADFCDARLRTAEAALTLLQSCLEAAPASSPSPDADESGTVRPEDAPLSLLHVEWYVVGGIRMRQHAAPTLGRLFRAFFPALSSSSSSATAAADRSATGSATLLATSRALRDLLSHSKTAKDTESGPAVTLQHRLREDGLCFWSLNTFISHWVVDTENPARRYAYPMCTGLLLRLDDGASWPVKLKPGTRHYPAAPLRSLLCSGVRWTAPIELPASPHAQHFWYSSLHRADNKTTTSTDANDERALVTGQLVTTALPATVTQTADGEWKVVKAPAPPKPVVVTLSWYVKRCLSLLERWRMEAPASSRTVDATPTTSPPSSVQSPLGDVSACTCPLLLASHATWEALPRANYGHLLCMPDAFFLQFSTTPHCEPEDFGSTSRRNFEMMMTWKHEDVFTPDTDGLLVDAE